MSQGETRQARAELDALHDDLMLLFGPDDEHTQEIADLLLRLGPEEVVSGCRPAIEQSGFGDPSGELVRPVDRNTRASAS